MGARVGKSEDAERIRDVFSRPPGARAREHAKEQEQEQAHAQVPQPVPRIAFAATGVVLALWLVGAALAALHVARHGAHGSILAQPFFWAMLASISAYGAAGVLVERRADWKARGAKPWLFAVAWLGGAALTLALAPEHVFDGLDPSVLAFGGAFVLSEWRSLPDVPDDEPGLPEPERPAWHVVPGALVSLLVVFVLAEYALGTSPLWGQFVVGLIGLVGVLAGGHFALDRFSEHYEGRRRGKPGERSNSDPVWDVPEVRDESRRIRGPY